MRKLETSEIIERKGDADILRTRKRNEVYLILDNIRSMYNVGAIFRTADAARVKKMFLCGITATPPRKEIEKTALKTVDSVPWEYSNNIIDVINDLKSKKVQIVALEQTNQSVDYRQFNFKKPIAIIVGHETMGVDDKALGLCDASIEIPMYGVANSLNVATATGIILYQII